MDVISCSGALAEGHPAKILYFFLPLGTLVIVLVVLL